MLSRVRMKAVSVHQADSTSCNIHTQLAVLRTAKRVQISDDVGDDAEVATTSYASNWRPFVENLKRNAKLCLSGYFIN